MTYLVARNIGAAHAHPTRAMSETSRNSPSSVSGKLLRSWWKELVWQIGVEAGGTAKVCVVGSRFNATEDEEVSNQSL